MGQLLPTSVASGPCLQTIAEIERLVQEAMRQPLAVVEERFEAIRESAGQGYDLVLHERYMRVHRMACDLSTPSAGWQTQCGWRFAPALGWRLTSSAAGRLHVGWRKCTRCKIPEGVLELPE